MNNIESQLSRMKSMMNYGLQTENKTSYKSVEYQKLAADGKTYGIVREGTKFYIKVSESQKPNLVKENFDYIGGFRNRKSNEFESYAKALKQFDMKMIDLKESKGNKTMVVESWNPEKNEYLVVEATEKMKNEIARQRQIMNNAMMINEGKSCSCDGCECAKEEKGIQVLPKGKGGDIFTEPAKSDDVEGGIKTEKNNIGTPQKPKKGKAVKEAADRLAWHQSGGDAQSTMADTYLDTSHGTEIGSSAPFTKGENDSSELNNGTVEEGVAMHTQGNNQNSPSVGVGEVGDDDPFTDKAKNGLQEDVEGGEDIMTEEGEADLDDDFDDDDFADEGDFDGEDSIEGDEEFEDDDFDDEDSLEDDDIDVEDLEDEDPFEGDDELEDDSSEIDDLKDEISQLKDMLSVIMDKVGADSEEIAEIEFDDDSLYDDDEDDDFDDEEDFEDEDDDFADEDDDFEDEDDDFDDEEDFDEDEDDDFDIHESVSYRRMKALNEDRLDMFGKHPAYRKKVMTYPTNGEDENQWGRDWNDESVHGEEPYGKQIGSSAPFEVSPESIDNAIAESVKRVLGRK